MQIHFCSGVSDNELCADYDHMLNRVSWPSFCQHGYRGTSTFEAHGEGVYFVMVRHGLNLTSRI